MLHPEEIFKNKERKEMIAFLTALLTFETLCCKVIATEWRIKSNSPRGNSFPHTRHSTVRSKIVKKLKN